MLDRNKLSTAIRPFYFCTSTVSAFPDTWGIYHISQITPIKNFHLPPSTQNIPAFTPTHHNLPIKNVHPSHRPITNVHPFPPTQNIPPKPHTHVHLHIKNAHPPKIYLNPSPLTHKKYLATPTHPKYTSTHPHLPPLTHKKCPPTLIYPKYTPNHPHLPMNNVHSHKLYLHLPLNHPEYTSTHPC